MKTASIRDLRNNVAAFVDGDEPVLVTRRGKHAALLYPLSDPKKIPLEIRRKLFLDLTTDIGRKLDAIGVTDEDVERDFKAAKKRRRR